MHSATDTIRHLARDVVDASRDRPRRRHWTAPVMQRCHCKLHNEMSPELAESPSLSSGELRKHYVYIYSTGEWPNDFTETVIVPLQKKPNATECGDHHTISLISHASKILLNILTKRLEAKVDSIHFVGEDQFGFRKGRGTRDAIASFIAMLFIR